MDTCSNVPAMCRKKKQRVQGHRKGRCHLKETACGNELREISEDGTVCCSGHERGWRGPWRCGWPPSTWRQKKTLHQKSQCYKTANANQERCIWVIRLSTSQKCIRSLIWNSRRGTWNAAWRRSPCGCFRTLRGWWLSSPAEEGWLVDNHPVEKLTWTWNKKVFWPV